MAHEETVTLNLQNAPLAIALAALDANAELSIDWPKSLDLAELGLPKNKVKELDEKLQWIKRQYDVLARSPKTEVYAPHVIPYLALSDLHIVANGRDFAASAAMQTDYPLGYMKNLNKTLKDRFKIDIEESNKQDVLAGGALVEDRTRFRVIEQSPLNELEAGFIGFYENSGLAYAAAYESWLELSYEEKQKLLADQLKSGKAETNYKMELVLEPQLLLDGVKAGLFKVLAVQPPTPAHGYSLPKKLPDGGMMERCFDISYELHSELAKEHEKAAPLVCLWGHRQRALIKTDIKGLSNMANVQKNRLKRLSDVLLDKLAEKHPFIVKEVRATVKDS